jgi:hypothetical protein
MNTLLLLFSLMAFSAAVPSCMHAQAEVNTVKETPGARVPDEYTGKWLSGDFDMSLFWKFNAPAGDNSSDAVAYHIRKDGSAEQFLLGAKSLYPAYAPRYRNCFFSRDNPELYLVATNDQDIRQGFARVEW